MESGSNEEEIHPHCLDCIKIWKCTVRPRIGESCEIIHCDLDCGARFHACKKKEHKLMCINEKVPCINAVNGCPSLMQRKHLGRHLKICPASVVHCTMEWNRWPIHVHDRQLPCQCHHQVLQQAQLDVALALRDQRMLRQWWTAPRCTRHALRNSLTKKFPPVPLSPYRGLYDCENSQDSSQTSRTVSDDESDTPWEMRKAPPGLQRSVCSELYRASRQATETLSAALNMITNHTSNEVRTEVENDYEIDMDSIVVNGFHSDEENKENIMDYRNFVNKNKHESNLSQHNEAIPMDMSSTISVNCPIICEKNREYNNGTSVSRTNHEFNLQDVLELVSGCDVLFVNDTVVSEISSASILDHARKDVNPPVSVSYGLPQVAAGSLNPSSTPPWCIALGLDLNLESITRYQAKPKSMYTFLCAQEFRRDEYAWHYKNVHSEIHGGLNGWLEQRCPLAQYGCMFARRRFYPAPKGSTIVHNEILESFGVKPPVPTQSESVAFNHDRTAFRRSPGRTDKLNYQRPANMGVIHETDNASGTGLLSEESNGQGVNITQLPFEILQHIARFLDSFSLCNLSLTSRLFRDVCCSLLEERGVVVFQWERRKINSKYSWRVAYKRWFFSTSFTPIEQWCFEDSNNMANHLKTCLYFNRNMKTDPYYYPMGLEPNENIYKKLKDSITESTRGAFENVTTKL